MSNGTTRLTAAVLAVAVMCGSGAQAAKGATAAPRPAAVAPQRAVGAPQDMTSGETVYVMTSQDGEVRKVIVSDGLAAELERGAGGAAAEGIFDSQGAPVRSAHDIKNGLPVDVRVSYTLDGAAVSPQQLAGKSGRVCIRFEYENTAFHYENIGGERVKVSVPFVCVTGVLLDSARFSGVEVSSGRVVDDGSHTAVVGIALPGLGETLGADSGVLELPSFVEITADVKGFEMSDAFTVAVNGLFGDISGDGLPASGSLDADLARLTDGMQRLTGGSSQLYDGLCELLDRSGQLTDGVAALSQGASALEDGIASAGAGSRQLAQGAAELSGGLRTIDAGSASLTNGARDVFATLLANADAGLAEAGISAPAMTPENYSDVLTGIISSLDGSAVYNQALAQVTQAVNARRDEIRAGVAEAVRQGVEAEVNDAVRRTVTQQATEAVRAQVSAQAEADRPAVESAVISAATGGAFADRASFDAAIASGGVSAEQAEAVEAEISAKMSEAVENGMAAQAQAIAAAVEQTMGSADTAALIEQRVEQAMQSADTAALIESNTDLEVEKRIAETMASEEIRAQLSAASQGAAQVIALKTSLDSYNAFYRGLISYTAGVASAAEGAGRLAAGAQSLDDGLSRLGAGATQLCSGLGELEGGAPALADGITRLKDGSMQLSDGLAQFDSEGIEKLVEAVGGDLEGLARRAEAAADAAESYTLYDGCAAEVKFIYKTEGIG